MELSRPDKVCQTQQFFQYAIVSDSVIDPTHHPCLHSLPTIFFKAMQGVSAMVDAYLGELPSLKKGYNLQSTKLQIYNQMQWRWDITPCALIKVSNEGDKLNAS